MGTKTEEMQRPVKTATKEALNKLKRILDVEASRPVQASAMSPVPVQIVVEVSDSTVALVWVDAAEKVQRLEMHAINALLLAKRIADFVEPKYERTKDGAFVPKGMTKMLKSLGKGKKK